MERERVKPESNSQLSSMVGCTWPAKILNLPFSDDTFFLVNKFYYYAFV